MRLPNPAPPLCLLVSLRKRIASALTATNRDALLCLELGRLATRYDTLIRRRPDDGEAGAGRTPSLEANKTDRLRKDAYHIGMRRTSRDWSSSSRNLAANPASCPCSAAICSAFRFRIAPNLATYVSIS